MHVVILAHRWVLFRYLVQSSVGYCTQVMAHWSTEYIPLRWVKQMEITGLQTTHASTTYCNRKSLSLNADKKYKSGYVTLIQILTDFSQHHAPCLILESIQNCTFFFKLKMTKEYLLNQYLLVNQKSMVRHNCFSTGAFESTQAVFTLVGIHPVTFANIFSGSLSVSNM